MSRIILYERKVFHKTGPRDPDNIFVGAQRNLLIEMVLVCTHNIWFG